jgi:hypothetical protein
MRMKKGQWLLMLLSFAVLQASAQLDIRESPKGFDRTRLYIGSDLNLGLSDRFFNIGINPQVGYSINKFVDLGVAMNLNYYSQSATVFDPFKYKNFNFGAGAFLRIWPLPFLHFHLQPEYNWINSSQTLEPTGENFRLKLQAPSLLAGIGYGSREIGNRITYFTILIDLNQAVNSPYRNGIAGDPQPIFRGGFGFYLNQRR